MSKKGILATILLVLVLIVCASVVLAGSPCDSEDSPTTVPGHCDKDGSVVGHYESLYSYDTSNWFWDLGDGRVLGTVDSVDELDPATLTTCDYVNNYRGDFGGDPYLDSGWIQNHINCRGYDDNNHYNYLIVHESDPRYTGNPEWAIWGTWEYHALTISGYGNLVRPENAVGS